MKNNSQRISPLSGFVMTSEFMVYRNQDGILKQSYSCNADYGTLMTFALSDHLPNLKLFLDDLNAHKISRVEDGEKRELLKRTKPILNEWIYLLGTMQEAGKRALDFPKFKSEPISKSNSS